MRSHLFTTSLLSLLALVALPAQAGKDTRSIGFEKHLGSVGSVNIAETITVPFFLADTASFGSTDTTTADWSIRLRGTVSQGDESADYGFTLSTRSDIITITDTVVSDLELKVKTANKTNLKWLFGEGREFGTGGEIKYVDIDRIAFGDLVLENVRALVSSSEAHLGTRIPDLQIGMGALPELAYAISRSKGTVSFAPAATGVGLVTANGGITLPYSSEEWAQVRHGSSWKIKPSRTLIVEAQVGDFTGKLALANASRLSHLTSSAQTGKSSFNAVGDLRYQVASLQLGTLDLGPQYFSNNPDFERGAFPGHDGLIGGNVLAWVDLAVDPVNKVVALTPAKGNTAKSWIPRHLEYWEDKLAKSEEEAAEAETAEAEAAAAETTAEGTEEDAEDKDLPPGDGDIWTNIGDTKVAMGDLNGAIEAYGNVTAHKEDDCEAWMKLSTLQLATFQYTEARASMDKAIELNDAWWGLERDERLDLKERMARAEDKSWKGKLHKALFNWADEPVPEDVKEQSHECHVAHGVDAALHFVSGNPEETHNIYAQRLDLDSHLALVEGNARLAGGELDEAQAALRQAIKLERSPDFRSRLGLGMIYANQGDWNTAEPLFEKALETAFGDPLTVSIWLDALREAKGPEASLAAANELVNRLPDQGGPLYGLVRELGASGDLAGMVLAVTAADAHFNKTRILLPRNSASWSIYSRYLVLVDRLAQAEEAADKAVLLQPANAMGWLAKADVAAAKGDTQAATSHLRKAAQLNPGHPGHAILLGQF